MDSSVIFALTIVLWATLCLPYWVRRRNDLAQARINDRFSEHSRVLVPRSAEPVSRVPRDSRTYLLTGALRPPVAAIGTGTGPSNEATSAPEHPAAIQARPRRRTSHRARRSQAFATFALVVGVVSVPVAVGLAVRDVVPDWAGLAALGALVVLALALRIRARRQIIARSRAATVVRATAVIPAAEPVEHVEDVFDEDAHRAAEEAERIRMLAEEIVGGRRKHPARTPQPGEWTPVAVPPPAYLLKPHAPRRHPAIHLEDQAPVAPSSPPAASLPAAAERDEPPVRRKRAVGDSW